MIPIKSYADMNALVSQGLNNKEVGNLEKLGIDLKNLDAGAKEAKIKQVAVQFEQLMIDTLLKSAFKDEKEDQDPDGEETPLMTFGPVNDFKIMMLSQHISDNGGLGYQKVIEQQIKEKLNTETDKPKDGESSVTQSLQSLPIVNALPQTGVHLDPVAPQIKSPVVDSINLDIVQPVQSKISSSFGLRQDPIDGKTRFHQGVDFDAPTHTQVKSVMEGEVVFSGWKQGYGNIVEIKHPDGYTSRYGHNSELTVKVGDKVEAGAVIALSGSSGRSTGPHLHFEVRKENVALNPVKFLKQNNINVFSK